MSAASTSAGRGRSAPSTAAPSRRNARLRDRKLARGLIMQIAGHCWDGKNAMLGRVYQTILRHNPGTSITHRRVRAFWHNEAARVDFCEMVELAHVASEVAAGFLSE